MPQVHINRAQLMLLLLLAWQSLQLQPHSQFHVEQPRPSFLSLYSSNAELNRQAQQLGIQYSEVVRQRSCDEDTQIAYLEFGNPDGQALAVIVCNIHARELITAEICMEWAREFMINNALQLPLHTYNIKLFYNSNINRQKVLNETKCERKSASGIDLNRNFPTEFNFYNVTSKKQIYSGTSPYFDAFTQCLHRLLHKNKPVLFVDIHSGENGGLFYQQGYNSKQDREIFQRLNEEVCGGKCRLTTLARDGEAINGHIFASLKVRNHVKYSLLIEAYGNERQQNQDPDIACLKQFNPITEQQKNQTIQKWVKGLNLIFTEVKQRQKL